jgi:SPP1 gp7 family putative phage head morphogenesis protein
VKSLRAILKGVHEAIETLVLRDVLPAAAAAAATRHDADESIPDRARRVLTTRLENRIAKHVRVKAAAAYDVMAGAVDKKNKGAMRLIALPVHEVAVNAGGKVAEMRENAIRLVENAGRAYAADVRDVFTDPKNEGLRVEALAEKLYARGNVSSSRAAMIGRDQTLKLGASLTQARFHSAGIHEYVWSGTLDERERPMHRELEGQVFSFDDPPVTNPDGDTNNAGEDYNCRCVSIPYISPDEDEDEESQGGAGVLGAAMVAAVGRLSEED